MANRKKISEDVVAQVLTASRRRCCLCWALRRDASQKQGQLAHLDGNPSNNDPDNLAFLCLEHHDQYDSKTSQSKGFTIEEVKHYREELLKAQSEEIFRSENSAATAPNVRVQVGSALAGVPWGDVEFVLAMRVENHSLSPVFIRCVTIDLTNKHGLFFKRDYLTKELNARRELRPGESFDFHITPKELFDGRTPEQLDSAVATDDLGRTFKSDSEKFKQAVNALYGQFRKNAPAI